MVKAVITSNLPFSFIENDYLVKAAATVGIKLSNRKQLAGPILDHIFEETQDFTLEALEVCILSVDVGYIWCSTWHDTQAVPIALTFC